MKYDLYADARHFIGKHFGGADMSSLPKERVREVMDSIHPDGWEGYATDYESFVERASAGDRTRPDEIPWELRSPIQKWAALRRHVHGTAHDFWIKPHTEVINVELGDEISHAALRIADYTEGARRDKIHRYGIKLMTWKVISTSERWGKVWGKPETLIVWQDEAPTEYARWGAVNTPERHASKTEQYDTCYRPGTHKSPMQGPAARLGVTREEFHGIDKKDA